MIILDIVVLGFYNLITIISSILLFEKYEYAKEHSLIFTSTTNIMTMYLLAELIF